MSKNTFTNEKERLHKFAPIEIVLQFINRNFLRFKSLFGLFQIKNRLNLYFCFGVQRKEWVSFAQNSIAQQILECRVFYLPYM